VLHHYRIWFAPANLLVCVALGYLGWIWGRLVETVKYLNSELNRLGEVAMPVIDVSYKDANKAFEFLMSVEGFLGGAINDVQGRTLFEWENSNKRSEGIKDNDNLVTVTAPVLRNEGEWQLSLQIDKRHIDHKDAEKIAQQLTTFYQADLPFRSRTPVEFINSRIQLVKQAHTRLFLLNNFISQVIDQLHNSVVVTDSFGNIIMANRGTDQLLEMRRSEIEELNIVELLGQFTFQESPDWSGVFSNVMFNGEQFIAEAKSKSGLVLLVEITRYKVDDESNFGLVFNFIDVTKLKETEQSRRELLAFLSHDLRSPLASLIATSDLAKIRPEYRESENFVKSIKDNANRALRLADDFLALVRAESINTESFQPVDFTRVVLESVNSIESSARARQISIVRNMDEEKRIFVNGVQSILERVVINLISNAIKYSPSGRKVEVGISTDNQLLEFWVKDNGYGIRPQDQEKVFKRFETIRHSKNSQDVRTGLGLTFVKSSVERHNGEITLESKKDKGSCFRIKMPLLENSKVPDSQKIRFKESG
jgi:signal transduction histidine kinase